METCQGRGTESFTGRPWNGNPKVSEIIKARYQQYVRGGDSIEYSLGNDLEIIQVDFALSPLFDQPRDPYLNHRKVFPHNYDTGRNDLIEEKQSYTAVN